MQIEWRIELLATAIVAIAVLSFVLRMAKTEHAQGRPLSLGFFVQVGGAALFLGITICAAKAFGWCGAPGWMEFFMFTTSSSDFWTICSPIVAAFYGLMTGLILLAAALGLGAAYKKLFRHFFRHD